MEDISNYINNLLPNIWICIKWILFFIVIITILKFIKSKIPRICKKKVLNWGLTDDEIRYIMEGEREASK